jgi:hypothetical protein
VPIFNGDRADDMSHLSEDPRVAEVRQRLALHVGVVLLIAASQVVGAQPSPRAVTDAEILPVILKAALLDAGRADLRVDPRPLIADASYLYAIQPEVMAHVSAAVIDGRAAIIRAAGLAIVDTMVVNQSRNCPGSLAVSQPDSLGHVDNSRVVECPEKPFDVLAVGPPRPGSVAIPKDRVYDLNGETPACGYWAVRVIRTTLGHGGSSAFAADYVLAERAGKWVVVKTVGLMYTH